MQWYPTPSYLVKRRIILEHLEKYDGTNVLEVGCGCGDLLQVLERLGYSGMGIDISREALALAARGLKHARIKLACCSPGELSEQFDVVIASEVLEHHEDDVAFLGLLRDRLRERGRLLLTVPAHQADWGQNDDFCGHVRRYERSELHEKLEKAGFDGIEIYSYGVPVCNLMKPLYDLAIRSQTPSEDQVKKTSGSGGMQLMQWCGCLFRLMFNDLTMYPFYLLQRMFYNTDLGKGYLVVARKKELW